MLGKSFGENSVWGYIIYSLGLGVYVILVAVETL